MHCRDRLHARVISRVGRIVFFFCVPRTIREPFVRLVNEEGLRVGDTREKQRINEKCRKAKKEKHSSHSPRLSPTPPSSVTSLDLAKTLHGYSC